MANPTNSSPPMTPYNPTENYQATAILLKNSHSNKFNPTSSLFPFCKYSADNLILLSSYKMLWNSCRSDKDLFIIVYYEVSSERDSRWSLSVSKVWNFRRNSWQKFVHSWWSIKPRFWKSQILNNCEISHGSSSFFIFQLLDFRKYFRNHLHQKNHLNSHL